MKETFFIWNKIHENGEWYRNFYKPELIFGATNIMSARNPSLHRARAIVQCRKVQSYSLASQQNSNKWQGGLKNRRLHIIDKQLYSQLLDLWEAESRNILSMFSYNFRCGSYHLQCNELLTIPLSIDRKGPRTDSASVTVRRCPPVGWGKTFCRVRRIPSRKQPQLGNEKSKNAFQMTQNGGG